MLLENIFQSFIYLIDNSWVGEKTEDDYFDGDGMNIDDSIINLEIVKIWFIQSKSCVYFSPQKKTFILDAMFSIEINEIWTRLCSNRRCSSSRPTVNWMNICRGIESSYSVYITDTS